VLRIVTYPHPALRFKSRPVARIDAHLRATVRRMFELMYEDRGIGLAANQVALPFRVFVLNLTADPERTDEERVFINPEISKRTSVVEDEEGCLSLPGLHGNVRRSKTIRVRAFDLTGRLFEADLDGLASRAVQHETDHLDGTLIIDRFDDDVRAATAGKLREIEAAFRKDQAEGRFAPDDQLERTLQQLAEAPGVPPLGPEPEPAAEAALKSEADASE